MIKSLESEVQRILDLEVEFFKKRVSPPSLAHFITPTRKFVVDPFDYRDKTRARDRLRKIAEKHKATMVVTVTNLTISKLKGNTINPRYFNRNALFAYGESKRQNFGLAQEFDYISNDEIQLGNLIRFPDGFGQGSISGFKCRKYWL